MSSSSKLWATASREWVIPSRPRPGRKPKNESNISVKPDDESPEAKGRRVQNRAAQRAFRERRQSQLAELQARVQSYERGEIERNVALQNVAKRLKEENERLKREKVLLEKKVLDLEQQAASSRAIVRKRSRDAPTPIVPSTPSDTPSRKKTRTSSKSDSDTSLYQTAYDSPLSIITCCESNPTPTSFSPVSFDARTRDSPVFSNHNSPIVHMVDYSQAQDGRTAAFDPTTFYTSNCVLCHDDTSCVCREMALQPATTDSNMSCQTPSLKADAFALNDGDTTVVGEPIHLVSPTASSQMVIMESRHPTYQPPVPLRRRPGAGPSNNLFPVMAASPSTSSSPVCTGDPTNCNACRDDAFGQAFCAAVGQAVSNRTPCNNCPRKSDSESGSRSSPSGAQNGPSAFMTYRSETRVETKMIPTSDAWRQLQSHPNVSFDDLALLADVVARKCECTGPQVMVSAPHGSASSRGGEISGGATQHPPIILVESHANYLGTGGNSQPSGVHFKCGRRPVCEVNADGVADALRLLDNKFSR